jgi:hypothetical protein
MTEQDRSGTPSIQGGAPKDRNPYDMSEDHPAAQWWWLVPMALAFFCGGLDWFSHIAVEFDRNIGAERMSTVLGWTAIASAGMLFVGSKQNTVWEFIVHCKRRIILFAIVFGWLIYAHDYRNETRQVIYFAPQDVHLLCEDEDHPKGQERNIALVGGVVTRTYKGTKKVGETSFCKSCWDARAIDIDPE